MVGVAEDNNRKRKKNQKKKRKRKEKKQANHIKEFLKFKLNFQATHGAGSLSGIGSSDD